MKRKASESYLEKLRDPRWQKMRLEILQRDEWQCKNCGSGKITLHVHHRWYERGREPWDYPTSALVTLCETCHQFETDFRSSLEDDLLSYGKDHLFANEVFLLGGVVDAIGRSELASADVFMHALSEFISTEEGQKHLLDWYRNLIAKANE